VDVGFLAGYPEASAFWEAHPELTRPPQQRPEVSPGRPLRVAVVTLCDAAMEPLCAASIDNKRVYAERHGAPLFRVALPNMRRDAMLTSIRVCLLARLHAGCCERAD
jgi:hypothetical protein